MKVAVHTSGRQDWGILRPVCAAIAATPGLELQLVAGGMHARDGAPPERLGGWPVAGHLADLPDGDGPAAVARAAARTLSGLADLLPRLAADAVLLCGDRSETLAAATAAACLRLPVCHLHGGETTLGAIDEACRHAVTRLASLHGVAHPEFARRLRRWDVPADRIVVCGAPALDDLLSAELPSDEEMSGFLSAASGRPLVLLTHHPATLGMDPGAEIAAVLDGLAIALDGLPDARVVATRPNVDAGGGAVAAALWEAARTDPRITLAGDLGSRRWWGLMTRADVLLGNSSSAILEAPCFGLPAVNVGDRQRGRLRLGNVIDCDPDPREVAAALARALADPGPRPRQRRATAYGDGHAGTAIAAALCRLAALPPAQRLATVDP